MSVQKSTDSLIFPVFAALLAPVVVGLAVFFTIARVSTITPPNKSDASGIASIERLNVARVSARPSANPH